MAQGPSESFDFFRDAPLGLVIPYDGALSAHENLPGGANPKWDVIGIDMALLGADSDIGNAGTEGGSESLASEIVHSGSAVANHTITQPADHLDHLLAGAHRHDVHTSVLALGAILSGVLTGPVQHSSDGDHSHNAHSAHAGTAVDDHSVTQPAIHEIKKFHRSYLLKKMIA